MYASQHDWLEQKYLHLQGIAYALHIHTLQVPFVTDEAEGLVILNFLYPYCKKKQRQQKKRRRVRQISIQVGTAR
jgi:hypothetical protein